jgi:protease-4
MSPEFRKQLESVVDDYYQQMVSSIAEARKLDAEKVKQLVDQGLFTAEEAKQAGLVDRICYEDELEAQLKSEHQAEELSINRKYGKKQREELDFSGIGGFMKFMEHRGR